MSKIFVLGANGYVGSALVNKIKALNEYVVISAGREGCDIYLDLLSSHQSLLDEVEPNDFVVFLAAASSPDICNNKMDLASSINVTATGNLIETLISKGVRVIFSSTDVVFGNSEHKIDDGSELCPAGAYGKMKAEIEVMFKNEHLFKVVRFSYIIGPGDKYTSMLFNMAEKNQTIEVFDGFDRCVVALSDVIDGLFFLIKKWDNVPEGSINFAGPECISRWALTTAFAERFCPTLKCSLVEAPNGFWDSRPKRIDMKSSLFSKLLGKKPKTIHDNFKFWTI